MIMLKRKCPICNCTKGYKLDQINTVRENESVLPQSYDIVCCEKCGFTFSSMEADQNVFDKYYATLNIYSEAEILRKTQTDFSNPYFCYIYDEVSKYITHDDCIIDIGCGGGQLLEYLHHKGYDNLYGLDPSFESIKHLNNAGITGIQGSIFSNIDDKSKARYDLVISTMVAEHIYDLNLYVCKIKEYVSEKGYIFLTVPSVESFKDVICQKANYFNQEHINFFSVESIQNLFGKHGFWLVNTDSYISETEEEKCLYLLFKNKNKERELVKDSISRFSIEEYLKKYNELNYELQTKLKQLIEKNMKVVLWGSGQYAKQILCDNPQLTELILFIVDNNTVKHGSKINGKDIVSPDKLCDINGDYIICICSMKNSSDIICQIKNMNVENEIVVL